MSTHEIKESPEYILGHLAHGLLVGGMRSVTISAGYRQGTSNLEPEAESLGGRNMTNSEAMEALGVTTPRALKRRASAFEIKPKARNTWPRREVETATR